MSLRAFWHSTVDIFILGRQSTAYALLRRQLSFYVIDGGCFVFLLL